MMNVAVAQPAGAQVVDVRTRAGVTQRILTISVPFAIILAGFALKKWQKLWWLWLTLLIIYTVATFFMDSYILLKVNI